MGRRDTLKILTTAILVVLLLSSFLFAFIYRNEIYQKLQTLGKKSAPDLVDREIQPISPEGKDPNYLPKLSPIPDEDTNLPSLPSLDEMETGVAGSKTNQPKKEPNPRTEVVSSERKSLEEKLNQVEDQFSPKTQETKVVPKPTATSPKPKGKIQKVVSSATQTSPKKKRAKTVTKKPISQTKATKLPSSDVSTRLSRVEKELEEGKRSTDKRFQEVERRIEALEKALAK